MAEVPPGVDNMAFNSDDRLFVSNFRNGAIHKIRPSKQHRTVSSQAAGELNASVLAARTSGSTFRSVRSRGTSSKGGAR